MDTKRCRIAIIGAGPAGLIAAQTLAQDGHGVDIFDRMPSPGRKFLLAGRGGLNLTHSEPLERFLGRYGEAATRLEAAIHGFPPDALRAWSADLGEETFAGSSGRVFPRSFKASPLMRAWLRRLDTLGARLNARWRWTGWDGEALTFDTPDGIRRVIADATLLALGGASWPRLGSDGSWTAILAGEGVELRPLTPANCGIEIGWSSIFAERFAGQPLKRIAASAGGTSVRGEAMVTREGIEGGAIYALLPALRDVPAVTIDLRPDMSEAALATRLAGPWRGETLTNVLRKRLSLAPVAIGLMREAAGSALPGSPEALAALVKAVRLPVIGLRPIEKAISTAGGVDFAAIDDRFMLKARPGVFVAGEMLDWEAPTGGYLLQASFATGVAAARGMEDWLEHARSARLQNPAPLAMSDKIVRP